MKLRSKDCAKTYIKITASILGKFTVICHLKVSLRIKIVKI